MGNIPGSVRVGVDYLIVDGPTLAGFLAATLRGGSGLLKIKTTSGRVRNTRPVERTIVNIVATCEDGSGQLFNFTGTLEGRAIRGFYNAAEDSSEFKKGTLSFV